MAHYTGIGLIAACVGVKLDEDKDAKVEEFDADKVRIPKAAKLTQRDLDARRAFIKEIMYNRTILTMVSGALVNHAEQYDSISAAIFLKLLEYQKPPIQIWKKIDFVGNLDLFETQAEHEHSDADRLRLKELDRWIDEYDLVAELG